MATITASATGGNWSATAAWVGSVVPGAGDDVLLTAASGNITIDGTSGTPSKCRSLNCSTYTGTLTHAASAFLAIGDGSGGSLTLVAGMTYVPNGSSTLQFVSTTTGNTITTAGKAMGPITFNGVGGGWTFADGYTSANSGQCQWTLTAGALNTGNQNFNIGGMTDGFSSSVKSLTLGSSTLTCKSGGTAWIFSGSNGTLSAGTSTLAFAGSFNSVSMFGGGRTYNNLTTDVNTIQLTINDGGNTFSNLTMTGANNIGAGLKIHSGGTTTIGTLTITPFNSTTARSFIQADTIGTAATLSVTTLALQSVDIQDVTAAGSANWNLSAITGLSGDCGGNTGITFTTGINCFMKTGASAQWSAANWFTTSGGATPARMPLPQDTAVFDANSFTAGSITITFGVTRMGAMNWTGATHTPTLALNSSINCYGSITFIAGMTLTGVAGISFGGRTTNTWTTAGLTWPNNVTMSAPGGTITMQDNLLCTSNLNLNAGTLAAGGHNITFTTIADANNTAKGIDLSTGTPTLTLTGTGTVWSITSTSATITPGSGSTIVISDTSAATKTFFNNAASGSNVTFNNITVNGAASNGVVLFSHTRTATVNGTFTAQPNASIQFLSTKQWTIATINWVGTSGNLVTITASIAASAAIISCPNLVSCNFISLKDNTASGSTPFFAGPNSTNVSGNTNWNFTLPIINLSAKCSIKTFGNATAKGVVGLSAASQILVKGSLKSNVLIALAARASAMIKGQAQATGKAALTAKSKVVVQSKAAPIGRVSLSGLAKAVIKARAAAKGSVSLSATVKAMSTLGGGIAVTVASVYAGLIAIQVTARAVMTLTAALSGKGEIQTKSSASISGATSISGKSAIKVFAKAPIAGAVPLAGKSSIKIKAQAAASPFVLLAAKCISQVKASASFLSKLSLSGRATAQVKSAAQPSGVVSLSGKSAIQIKTRANTIYYAFLGARSSIMVTMRTAVNLPISLFGRAAIMVKSVAGFRNADAPGYCFPREEKLFCIDPQELLVFSALAQEQALYNLDTEEIPL